MANILSKIFRQSEQPIASSITPYISAGKDWIKSAFKGDVEQSKIKFPKDLGEEHPFDFKITEGIYKKFGYVQGSVDKYIDFMVSGFYVESDNDKAKQIIEDFIRDVDFDSLLRQWIKEALNKGNGFIEIGGKKDEVPQGLKVLNANNMYVVRDKKGVVEDYNQYTKSLKSFSAAKDDVNNFKPFQIAHLKFNIIGDCAYGYGLIYSSLPIINDLIGGISDMHMILNRKANTPYDITLGNKERNEIPSDAAIDKAKQNLQYLNNTHEWVHGVNMEIKTLDLGNVEDKFQYPLEFDIEMLNSAFQIPAVLQGKANVAEGLAKVQMDAFQRNISSKQSEVEKVIEDKIFKRVLEANGISAHVEFQWGQPSLTEQNDNIDRLTNALKLPLTRGFAEQIELKLAKEFDIDPEVVMTAQEEREEEETAPLPRVPGEQQNQGYLNTSKLDQAGAHSGEHQCHTHESYETDHQCHTHESYETDHSINEWLGFNYSKYKKAIIAALSKEGFGDLLATTDIQLEAGKFSDIQVEDLRSVLKNGFAEEKSIQQIAAEIKARVDPSDLYKVEGDKIVLKEGKPVVVAKAANRAVNIARTETTRAATKGALLTYKEGKIQKVRFMANLGERTCPECEGLDGQIYDLGAEPSIPVHSQCRCTFVPITELGGGQ